MEERCRKHVWKFSVIYFTVKFSGKEKYDAFFKFRKHIFTASTESPVEIQKYFLKNLSSYERIGCPFAQPTPSSFTEQEEEDYLDLTCDNSLKRKFNLVNLTNFWISLNDEYPALMKKALRMFILFAMSYLCEAELSAMAVIKSKYRS